MGATRCRLLTLGPGVLLLSRAVSSAAALSFGSLAAAPSSSSSSSTISGRAVDDDAATSGSSDFVQLFQQLYTADAADSAASSASALNLTDIEIPAEVQSRLQTYALVLGDLPPLLQRALLWDSGYSLAASTSASSNGSSLAQIFTLCGSSMVDLALSRQEFAATKCATRACAAASSTNTTYLQSSECRADQLVLAAKCSTTAVDAASSLPLWAEPSMSFESTMNASVAVPEIRVRRHEWLDAELGQQVHVFAIHSSSSTDTAAASADDSACASPPVSQFPTIPCVSYKRTDARWCRPRHSQRMDDWLNAFATASRRARKREIDAVRDVEAAQRQQQRGNATEDENGVAVDAAFAFDGSNSDLAQQFYRRFLAGDSAAPMVITSTLPSEILERLRGVSLDFGELPPLLQRALVWDAGFAYGDGSDLAAIYVPCGNSMADLAVSARVLDLAGCVRQTCTDQLTGASFSRGKSCTSDQIATVSLCAATDVSSPVHVSVWADGGYDELVPDVNILRHTWEARNRSHLVYGIHVVRNEVAQLNCPARGAMIIPCLPFQVVEAAPSRWCRPRPGTLVTSWLRLAAKDKPFNWFILLPILVSAALVMAGAIFCMRRKTWQQRLDAKMAQQHELERQYSHMALTSASQRRADLPADAGLAFTHHHDHDHSDPILSSLSRSSRSSIESFAAMSINSVLNALVNDPLLSSRRVDFVDLRFERMIAKGGHGEVWLCRLHRRQVAVKRLLRTRKNRYDDLEAFTGEIALTASMDHPNIVRFVGVAWTTLPNLCMVTEYMANGDLQQFLRRDDAMLEWTTDKLRIASGIAVALQYLHEREPATIHRDLKSKNVMLSSELNAKLIDFGVSRSSLGDMMTKGVGTPYWTAPEILQGQPYSEKADMYSFGIVLCELDTAITPYQDRTTRDGTPEFTPLQILQHVVSGELRPTISASCPQAVADLVRACLHRDAAARPSAAEALLVLQRCDPDAILVASVEVPVPFHAYARGRSRHTIAFSL